MAAWLARRSDYPTEATMNPALHFLACYATYNNRYRGASFCIISQVKRSKYTSYYLSHLRKWVQNANMLWSFRFARKPKQVCLHRTSIFQEYLLDSEWFIFIGGIFGLRAFLAALSAITSRVRIGSSVCILCPYPLRMHCQRKIPEIQLHFQDLSSNRLVMWSSEIRILCSGDTGTWGIKQARFSTSQIILSIQKRTCLPNRLFSLQWLPRH